MKDKTRVLSDSGHLDYTIHSRRVANKVLRVMEVVGYGPNPYFISKKTNTYFNSLTEAFVC